ncbi:MAG: hypothetical protein QMC67_14370 [Candidatus Wallbacteria bacterium]
MLKLFYINRSIAIIFINNFWNILKGPVSIYILLRTLTPEQQGLWYTFISLSALTVFAEMGFTNIITRFVSHEFAHLKFDNNVIIGEDKYLIRIISLIRYAIKFYFFVIPLAVIILIIIGFYFFKTISSDIFIAWVLYSISSGINLFVSLLQSIYQGLNKVYEIQHNIFLGSIFTTLLTWFLLCIKLNIWALVISNYVGLIFTLILLIIKSPKFWHQIYVTSIEHNISWFKEIVSLQLKYAISWISGYLVFQLYIPLTYKYCGAVIAGKLGITLTIVRIIISMSNAWISSEIPKLNILVSQKKYIELKQNFNKAEVNGFLFYIISGLIFVFMVYFMKLYNFYFDRFVGLDIIILMLSYELCSLKISFMANYLRSFKKEPYYILSFFNGVMISFIIMISLLKSNLIILFILINFLNWLVILPWALKIFYSFEEDIK